MFICSFMLMERPCILKCKEDKDRRHQMALTEYGHQNGSFKFSVLNSYEKANKKSVQHSVRCI
uniref:Uncharacterized protein n=1 Tax=Anguilla anguilla TaxID=7936 RepID=A0A0E9QF04_ANGAN